MSVKKKMDRRGQPEWKYKAQAIRTASAAIRAALDDPTLDQLTLVPIPPSKARNDPLYDDRLIQILRGIRPNPPLDARELVVQTRSTDAVHDSDDRPTPDGGIG